MIGDTQALLRWFEFPASSTLFYLTQEGVNDEDFESSSISAKLIPVKTFNQVPSGSLPTVVDLTILYQQYDQYTKKIILATVTFSSFVSTSED